MGQYGLAGLVIPSRWGGVGVGMPTILGAVEAVAAGCGSTAWAFLAHCSAAVGILAAGSAAQKDRYLPALAQGRLVGSAIAAMEAGGGSNPMSIRTFARAAGNRYVMDGGKVFITQAGAADVYVVLVRTDEAPAPGSLSCLLVEKGDGGLTFGRREETIGLHGVWAGEMLFEQCRLPVDRLLGRVGGGFDVMRAIGGFAVMGAAAAALGLAQAAVNTTQTYLRDRKIMGQPLAALPGVQAWMADLLMDATGARAWLTHVLASDNKGAEGPPLPAWIAKVAVTEAAVRIIDRCMGLHGAYGYSRALPLERYSRDARAYCLHWGNNDVLRDSVGKMALA